jgi:gliding motility-associated-like protein
MNQFIKPKSFNHNNDFRLRKLLVVVTFILISSVSYSQQARLWCFGNYAGIDFSNQPPTLFTSSAMNTPEGCASIGGTNGTVKIYTNGVNVWDANHQIVETGLNGSIYSTQSALIIRHPKSVDQKIFVFTTDAITGPHGLQYTEFLDNGTNPPTLVSKNNPLLNTATERITIARHCNRHDFWIITHEWNSNAFYAYLLTADSLHKTPIISNVGSVHSVNTANGEGYLKASIEGNFLAQAMMGDGIVEVFRFDNATGTVYDPISLSGVADAYGVEFSFSETYLYASSASGQIIQWAINTYNQSAINQSKEIILQSTQLIGALQIAADKRIYVSEDNSYYLGAITKPWKAGLACNYDPSYIYLNGMKTEAGLPPEIPMHIYVRIQANTPCVGDTSFFDVADYYDEIDSVFWDFGDLTTDIDTSSSKESWYIYPDPGNYDVTLVVYYCDMVDTIVKDILIKQPPTVELGPDTSFCENSSLTLSGGSGPDYLWSTGSTNSSIVVSQTGTYWVRSSNLCGDVYDTVTVNNIWPTPIVSLPPDEDICYGDSVILHAGDSNYVYIWQGSDTAEYYTVKTANNYQLLAINQWQCQNSDNFVLSITYPPNPDLGNDTTVCVGNVVSFDAGYGTNYYWSNGSIDPTLYIDSSCFVWVEVSNKCGIASDSIEITYDECEKIIYVPNAFTPNNDQINDYFYPYVKNVETYTFRVFNRWGDLVFESNEPLEGWNGRYQNEDCPQDVYVWTVQFFDYRGVKHSENGFVVLYR